MEYTFGAFCRGKAGGLNEGTWYIGRTLPIRDGFK